MIKWWEDFSEKAMLSLRCAFPSHDYTIFQIFKKKTLTKFLTLA